MTNKMIAANIYLYLTLILLTDDSNIDERLNYIKKMCSLEGKNMFFVLPPSSPNELQEFATK